MQITNEMVDKARRVYGDETTSYWVPEMAPMRAALEAALAVAPAPAPDDAEMNAAVDALVLAALEHEDAAQWRDWESYEHLGERFTAARARILALHRQARHAGLRELSARIDIDVEAIPENKRGPFAVVAVAAMRRVQGQIDAMLTGKE